MRVMIYGFGLVLLAACAGRGSVPELTDNQLLSCQGYGNMAQDIAKFRDFGLDSAAAFARYEAQYAGSTRPQSMKVHSAFITKEVFNNPKLSAEAFHDLYNYACLASFQGVPLENSIVLMIRSAKLCAANVQGESSLGDCLQLAYVDILPN